MGARPLAAARFLLPMAYSLKPGVSFCHVSGRILFLDLAKDRYFCLSGAAEQSFRRLLNSKATKVGAEDPVLLGLVRNGPLRLGHGKMPLPCPAAEPVTASLLDMDLPGPGWRGLAAAALCLARAAILLRLLGIRGAVARIEKRKARVVATGSDRTIPARAAAAFRRLAALTTVNDRCLVRSLAVAERLLAVGATPQLIIGVKLEPFAAHAWVQCDGLLVNEHLDVARDFRPIRIV